MRKRVRRKENARGFIVLTESCLSLSLLLFPPLPPALPSPPSSLNIGSECGAMIGRSCSDAREVKSSIWGRRTGRVTARRAPLMEISGE